jgi:DNA repair exonuclease SbcCD ATPase subunit
MSEVSRTPAQEILELKEQIDSLTARLREVEQESLRFVRERNDDRELCKDLRTLLADRDAQLAHVTEERELFKVDYLKASQLTRVVREQLAEVMQELNATWVDEHQTAWRRPTAWAYAQVCRTLHEKEEQLAALQVDNEKELTENIRLHQVMLDANDRLAEQNSTITALQAELVNKQTMLDGMIHDYCELERDIEALGIKLTDDYGALDPGEELKKYVTALQAVCTAQEARIRELDGRLDCFQFQDPQP